MHAVQAHLPWQLYQTPQQQWLAGLLQQRGRQAAAVEPATTTTPEQKLQCTHLVPSVSVKSLTRGFL